MDHTLTVYDRELARLDGLIVEMGQFGAAQLQSALLALEQREALAAQEVVAGDEREDALELEVDELAVRVIALRQPTAGDLRSVTSAFKAAVHFERIADYAANLAKRSLVLPRDLARESLLGIPEMGRWTLDMLRDTVRAYANRDHELAISIWLKDQMLDTLNAELFVDIVDAMKSDAARVDVGSHLMFIAKNLERIGDHATNVCELIYYRHCGERLPRDRPRRSSVASKPGPGPTAPNYRAP